MNHGTHMMVHISIIRRCLLERFLMWLGVILLRVAASALRVKRRPSWNANSGPYLCLQCLKYSKMAATGHNWV